MLRVCLDTNVLLSGLVFSGPSAEIVSLAFNRKFQVVTSQFILMELEKNLVKKIELPPKKAKKLIYRLIEISDIYDPKGTVHLIKECPSDNFILETAWVGRAKYLITGDKHHLLPLKIFRNIKILLPASFIEIIRR